MLMQQQTAGTLLPQPAAVLLRHKQLAAAPHLLVHYRLLLRHQLQQVSPHATAVEHAKLHGALAKQHNAHAMTVVATRLVVTIGIHNAESAVARQRVC
jgi:hypothetical protein